MHKLVLIGCGRISFKHIEAAVGNVESIKLVACCDPVKERAELRASEYMKSVPAAVVNSYTDYRKMLDTEKPDICAIATESGYHPQIAIDCLTAGCHVICEKPMALSTKDADAMINAAEIGRAHV